MFEIVMSDNWAICLSQNKDHNLEFKCSADAMSADGSGVEWSKWESPMEEYTKTSPP